MTEPRPDLAQEGDDRRLAARAGDSDDGLRLTRIEARRRMGERGAHVGNDDERQRAIGGALRDDDGGAARRRVVHEGQPVAGMTGNREKGEALANRAAVGGQSGDLESRERGAEVVSGEELVETHQWPWPPVAGTLAMP